MNILIVNAHWGDRGDEAAIRAMIDSLRAELPVEKMWIMMLGHGSEQFPYDDIERLRLYPIPWYKVFLLDALLNTLTSGRLSLTPHGREFLRAVDEADVVIHAPGGPSIGDIYGDGLLGWSYLYRLVVAKVFKRKPLFFYAPSMGPFSGKLRNAARKFILRRADAIILRDEISRRYLKEQLGLDASVTADSALQSDVPEHYLQKYDNLSETLQLIERKRTVGMVITDLKWHPLYRHYEGLAERIMACCSEVAEYLLGKGYSILLIPVLFGAVDDIELHERIQEIDRERILICPPNIDSYGQQVIISKLFALIGMRYHPVVYAAKGNTPFISIYYEHKAEAFARKVWFEDFTINVETLASSEITRMFTSLEQNYEMLKEQLKAMNPQLREESRKTTRIIVDKLIQLGYRIDDTSKPGNDGRIKA